MPRAGPPASRRSSRSARACAAALAALPGGSRVGSQHATIMDRNTCPTPSSRNLPSWTSQARRPSCGPPRGMAVPSASSAHSRRTCSGCAPSTPSRSSVRRCSSFGRSTTRPGSSNGTGSKHPPPCGRTSFHSRQWPRKTQSGVSQTGGGTVGLSVGPFAQGGLDEALGLAVCLGRIGLGPDVLEAELAAGAAEGLGAIAGAIVGHYTGNRDAKARVVGARGLEEGDRALLFLVREYL